MAKIIGVSTNNNLYGTNQKNPKRKFKIGDIARFDYNADEGILEIYKGDTLIAMSKSIPGSGTIFPVVILQYTKNQITLL